MIPKIGQLLNRTVLVSIPALFSDGACRPYTLLGFELNGLWLQSDDLNGRLLTDETRDFAAATPIVFVPFAHIASVMVPTTLPATPRRGGPPTPAPGAARPAREKPAARQAGRQAGQGRTSQARRQGKEPSPKPE